MFEERSDFTDKVVIIKIKYEAVKGGSGVLVFVGQGP